MLYYCVRLSEDSINIFAIILIRLNYYCKCLQIGVGNSPDIFQHKTELSVPRFLFIPAYIYKLFIL